MVTIIQQLPWIKNDGGRAEAGYKGITGDCVVRAIAIATKQPYKNVYDYLFTLAEKTPRNGVVIPILKKCLVSMGWEWIPTMFIGSGCKVHLRKGEVPSGRIITRLSKHTCAVIDNIIQDTYDPGRSGYRCVYGYWKQI